MLRTTTAHALTDEGHRLVLQTPAKHYRLRGATLGCLLPVLLGILVGLFALLELLEVGEPGLLTAGMAFVAVLGSLLSLPWGLVMALRAPTLAAKTRVVIDLDQRVIQPVDGAQVPLSSVASLSLRKPNAMLKWMNIEADLHAATPHDDPSPYRAPRHNAVVLVQRINELEAEPARKLMETLGSRLDLPTADRSSSLLGGGGASGTARGRGAHAAAYVPVQGIFLLASIFLLIARRGDPRAMFHARQSMLLLAFEVAWVVGVVAIGVPLMLLSELTGGEGPHPVGIVFIVVGMLPFLFMRIGFRFYGAWRAWKGDAWLVPVVGRISRRWLPPEETSE